MPSEEKVKEMSWSAMPFGKYKGKTLPEVIFIDLDWFFWVLPKLYGKLGAEAQDLARKARAIKIPDRKKLEVEYQHERMTDFAAFHLSKQAVPSVPDGQPDFHTSTYRNVFAGGMISEAAAFCFVIFGVIILARING